MVRKVWPNDKNAFVRSGIMQADLATEFGASAKAVDTLLEVAPVAAKTEMEPQVEQKLGQAFLQGGNVAEAEKHLLAAEKAMHATHADRVESEEILSSVAMFYVRQNNPKEAIQRFREAQNLPGQDAVNKLHFQLAVAEQAVRLGKNVADPEFAHLDDLVTEARKMTLSPGDATYVDHMIQHAQRLRNAHP